MLTAVAGIAGVIFLCWLVFTLAVNALPFFVGLSAGMLALNSGTDTVGAFVVGIGAAVLTLAAGRLFFAASTSLVIRAFVAALFVVPASLAGYNVVSALVGLTDMTDIWRQLFGVGGALTVGGTIWQRLNVLREAGQAAQAPPLW